MKPSVLLVVIALALFAICVAAATANPPARACEHSQDHSESAAYP